jgi:ADP-ribosylglycohydrolase
MLYADRPTTEENPMTKNPGSLADRQRGIMFGLAYGDALGRPTEFLTAKLLTKFGPPFRNAVGLTKPSQGIVTDDTQMSIAVGNAAAGVTRPDPAALTTAFIAHFIRWYDDPKSRDGQRAPGGTCMGAVSALKRNPGQWLLATRPDSKGNGANMRVSPLALRTDWTWDQMGAAAQLQAAITHGHPVALAAAHLTAAAVRMLLEGVAKPGEPLLDHLLAYAYEQRSNYYGDALGHLWEGSAKYDPFYRLPAAPASGRLWEADPSWPVGAFVRAKPHRKRPAAKSPQEFIEHGWDKVIDALLGIYDMPRDQYQDPCDVAGGGWIAEEALACSLHTLLCFPDDPTSALRRAAFTDGDSDSIASITGALAGAAYGRSAFPSKWIDNLEYRAELDSLTARLADAAACSR